MVFRKKDLLRVAEDEVAALRERLKPLEARTGEARARMEAATASQRQLLIDTAGANAAAAQRAAEAVGAAVDEHRTYRAAVDELVHTLAQAESRVVAILDERSRDERATEAEARVQRITEAADAHSQAAQAMRIARQHLRDVLTRDAPRDMMGQVQAYRFDAAAKHLIGYQAVSASDAVAFGLDTDMKAVAVKVCAPLLAAASALRSGASDIAVPPAGPEVPTQPAPAPVGNRTIALWRPAYWRDISGVRIDIVAPGVYEVPNPIAQRALETGAAFEPQSQEGQRVLFVTRNNPQARFRRDRHGALQLGGALADELPFDLGSAAVASPAEAVAAA